MCCVEYTDQFDTLCNLGRGTLRQCSPCYWTFELAPVKIEILALAIVFKYFEARKKNHFSIQNLKDKAL